MRLELAALTEKESAFCLATNVWIPTDSVHFAAPPITDGPVGVAREERLYSRWSDHMRFLFVRLRHIEEVGG